MKSAFALCLLLCLIPSLSNAIDIRISPISETTAELTVDYSDGTVRSVNVSQTDLWAIVYDRFSAPVTFITIAVYTAVAAWPNIHLQCTWEERPPAALHLAYYNIWTPEFGTVKEQTATAITFYLDRDLSPGAPGTIAAVPDAGGSILLLPIGMAAVALVRRFSHCAI